MTRNGALEEALEYVADAIEQGGLDARMLTGDMLRGLVQWAHNLPDEVPIVDVWARAAEVVNALRT